MSSTHRARAGHLAQLVQRQALGRYKLPPEVLAAAALPTLVDAVPVPPTGPFPARPGGRAAGGRRADWC